jgi:hypothetical protein
LIKDEPNNTSGANASFTNHNSFKICSLSCALAFHVVASIVFSDLRSEYPVPLVKPTLVLLLLLLPPPPAGDILVTPKVGNEEEVVNEGKIRVLSANANNKCSGLPRFKLLSMGLLENNKAIMS